MGRYRRMITHDLGPFPVDPGPAVLGLNTTPPKRWKEAALPAIRSAGVELLLAGHLHVGYADMVKGGPGLLSVQAGTAISRRRRGQPNAYNVIRLGDGIVVEPRVWDGERFAAAVPAAR